MGHLADIYKVSEKGDKTQKPTKCTVRDPEIAVPYTEGKENIHSIVLQRVRQQKERTSSRNSTAVHLVCLLCMRI